LHLRLTCPTLFLITGWLYRHRSPSMGIVIAAGLLEISLALLSLWLLRRQQQLLSLLVLLVSAGVELVFLYVMFLVTESAVSTVVETILWAQLACLAGALLLTAAVFLSVKRAQAQLQREAQLLQGVEAQRAARQSFAKNSSLATHRIAVMFR
jgi:hypothetical protein